MKYADVVAYVERRGYKVEPAADLTQEGEVAAATLRGPRGNRQFVLMTGGSFRADEIKLWCDSVDYASARVRQRREERNR